MIHHWARLACVALGLLPVAAGCHCCGEKKPCPPRPCPSTTVPPAQPTFPGPPGAPPPGIAGAPGAPVFPGAAPPPPPSFPASPAPYAPPPPPAGATTPRFYNAAPPATNESPWEPARPAPGGVQLSPPQPAAPGKAGIAARPDGPVPAVAQLPATPDPKRPAVVDAVARTPALPVGIPQFTPVQPQIAAGLRPDLDGLDWIQGNGYRTVIHVRPAGTDDAADRRQVEKRGLTYVGLDWSVPGMTRPPLEEFGRLVADPARRPVFVYDQDGTLTGSLCYLHARLHERLSEDEARTRAARLGLKGDAEHRAAWAALAEFLALNPK